MWFRTFFVPMVSSIFTSYRYDVGNVAMFPGEDLIRDSNGGVVVVEIQYRLGLFGEIASLALKLERMLTVG